MSFEKFTTTIANETSNDSAYPPEFDDLYSLYSFVREKSVVSILEIGSGWSTSALALAIAENKQSFGLEYLASARHPNPFKILSVDASFEWSNIAKNRQMRVAPAEVEYIVSGSSICELGGPGGPICTLIDSLPFFVADLVYLDGPDSDQIHGDIRGHHFIQPHSVPMSADLLALEPHFWPGTYVITDGRFANAQFLRSRFRRNWEYMADPFADRCMFRLAESELGPVNREHISLRLRASSELLSKEKPLPT